MFRRIDHIEMVTADVERAVDFYTSVLGFSVRSRDRIPGSPLGVPLDLVYLDLGGTTVELLCYPGAAVEAAPRDEHLGYRMMALEVEDMKAAIEYVQTKNVPVVWGPKVRETYARAEIRDPDGNHIELRQWFR